MKFKFEKKSLEKISFVRFIVFYHRNLSSFDGWEILCAVKEQCRMNNDENELLKKRLKDNTHC